ncbi:MAG: DUF3616 domain-containing protein, partial [Phycisphaerales bacterium]|nr:DUF3616 domain-containing protein [Phycisphaerales bacterium]
MAVATPKRQPMLTLDTSIPLRNLADVRDNFSAIALAGGHLWLGGDEGTEIDRMTADQAGNFGEHQRFDLAPLLPMPAGAGSEIDIEGLDFDGGYLWMVGSHSLKRTKADAAKTPKKNRKRLEEVIAEPNRHTFARIPLDRNGKPKRKSGNLQAARLKGGNTGDQLTAAIRADTHLGASSKIPSKENGIDVEGLAVRGNRAYVGLRGPVLRGWAVVLEFEWKDSGRGSLALAGSVKKHFLQLDGLGVRELAIHRKDLYILAGPTMDLDGPVFIYRWPKALDHSKEEIVWRNDLERILAV